MFHCLYGDVPQFAACAFVLAADREHSYTPLTEFSKQELSSDLSASPAPAGETEREKRKRRKQKEEHLGTPACTCNHTTITPVM